MRKAVLIRMADRANDDGSGIYTSKSRIAAELECSRTTVQSATRELEEEGILLAVGKKTGNHGYTTIYQISVRNLHLLPDAWANCTDRSTLDSGLGEDTDAAGEAPNGEALDGIQVPKSTRSSANVIGKNRPYRTIETNSSNLKKGNGANQPVVENHSYDVLIWEARRVKRSDPERARELEDEAQQLLEKERADRGRTSAAN